MSKFVKVSLITAGILTAVGIVLCLVCALAGGGSVIYWANNDKYVADRLDEAADVLADVNIGKWHFAWKDKDSTATEGSGTGHEQMGEDNEKTNKITEGQQSVSIDAIRNLELVLGTGKFIIREKEVSDGVIDIYIEGTQCRQYVKDGTLHVENFREFHVFNIDASLNKVTIEIPQGMSFDEIDVELGAGTMEISDIRAKEFDAGIGAGELTIKNMETQELSVEIGAGELKAENVSARNADFEVSMGECVYRGTIQDNLDAECNMGNMEFYLTGAEEEHNYEIECGAGNIDVGGFSFSGLAAERKINNGAAGTFDISCNMGNITVCFE